MSHLTMADQTRLYYSDMGEGEPVVLIHGWPLNADMWEYQTLELLERGYRVIAYDRRGFGRSAHTAEGFDYDVLADDLNEVIVQLNLDKPALVGFSMGGGEVARYLSRYGSQDISRVILISAITPYLLKTDSNPHGVEMEQFQNMIKGLKKDRPHFLADFAKNFYGMGVLSSPVSTETLQWTQFMAFQASLKATVDCVMAFGTTDFRDDMKAFDIPTLIIHGSADKIVPLPVSGEAAARAIPEAIFRVYDGAPHGLFLTHREELIKDLSSFLAGVPPRKWTTQPPESFQTTYPN